MLRRFILSWVVYACLLPCSASAKPNDAARAIIERYVAATGGRAALVADTVLHVRGRVDDAGVQGTYESWQVGSRHLLQAAHLLTGDRHRAEDLLQTALTRAYLRWDRIVDEDPEGYVRRTMVNAHIDWWRRKPWREESTEVLPEVLVADAAASYDVRAVFSPHWPSCRGGSAR